jgi:hypothetical protein
MEMDITYADTSPPCPSCAALRARIEVLEKVAEYAEHHPGCGYTFDHVTQTYVGELVGCTCGLEAALTALKEGK